MGRGDQKPSTETFLPSKPKQPFFPEEPISPSSPEAANTTKPSLHLELFKGNRLNSPKEPTGTGSKRSSSVPTSDTAPPSPKALSETDY